MALPHLVYYSVAADVVAPAEESFRTAYVTNVLERLGPGRPGWLPQDDRCFFKSSSSFGIQVLNCHVTKLKTEKSWVWRYLNRREMAR